jgi:hypothetical protein
MESVSQIIERRVVKLLVNNELERMYEEAMFEVLSRHLFAWPEETQKTLSQNCQSPN